MPDDALSWQEAIAADYVAALTEDELARFLEFCRPAPPDKPTPTELETTP